MSVLPIFPYDEGIKTLAQFAMDRALIPFFGAGFTMGCQTKSCRMVPNSKTATETMRELILRSGSLLSKDELDSLDFFEISDLFFENVSRSVRATYFEEYFTGVKLYQPQIDFLKKINWPYAYTINVDDGIEKNTDFKAILPYHKFRRPRTSQRLLYKLHGDADYESTYIDDNQQNIVFSRTQYLQAITDEANSDIYEALLSDLSQRNMLFIGCSLQDEQDLKFVYEKTQNYRKEAYRIVLRSSEPTIAEQIKLKKHGITHILVVNNYESFYSDLINEFERQSSEERRSVYKHFNPGIRHIEDKERSLQLLSGIDIFDENNSEFEYGIFHIVRTAVRKIIDELSINPYVLLKGRRFSGKTYVLCSIAEYYKTKDVLYFPSKSFIDEDVLQKAIENQKNGLFLFDSNSVTSDEYALILKYAPSFKENGNILVFTANTSDNHLLTELKCNVVELPNVWDENEIAMGSRAFDSYGLIRRIKDQTNIDYLYSLSDYQRIQIPFIHPAVRFTPNEKTVLISLAALDKLYYSDLIALGFSKREIEQLCHKITPLVEIAPTTRDEVTRHSTSKLVHNSKIALIDLLSIFTTEDITNSIEAIVRSYCHDYSRRRLYIEVTIFDTIFQLFSKHKKAESLAYLIYNKLQPYLENEPHYWLQRAKAIYRTPNRQETLDDAYKYAMKAYYDGNESLANKAALTASLIRCIQSEQSSADEKLMLYEEAVSFAHEAVFSEHFRLHPAYLASELPIGKNTHSERRIVEACNYVMDHSDDYNYVGKAEDILQHFSNLKRNTLIKQSMPK